MTRRDYELLSQSIYRSGMIADKNKIRQAARESMRRLIASDIAGSIYGDNKAFDRERFLRDCGIKE